MQKYNKKHILNTKSALPYDDEIDFKIKNFLFQGIPFYDSKLNVAEQNYGHSAITKSTLLSFGKDLVNAFYKTDKFVFRLILPSRKNYTGEHSVAVHFDFEKKKVFYKDSLGVPIWTEIKDLILGLWEDLKIESDTYAQQNAGDKTCNLISLYNARSLYNKTPFLTTKEAREDIWENVMQSIENQMLSEEEKKNEKMEIAEMIADTDLGDDFDDSEMEISLTQKEKALSYDFSKQLNYVKIMHEIVAECKKYQLKKSKAIVESGKVLQSEGSREI